MFKILLINDNYLETLLKYEDIVWLLLYKALFVSKYNSNIIDKHFQKSVSVLT